MSEPLQPTGDEQARIDELRAKVGPLPEGVEMDFVVLDDAHAMAAQVAETDAAVFVTAKGYGRYELESGAVVPAVLIDVPWIEELVAAGEAECAYYGIVTELGGAPIGTQLHFRLNIAPLYIAIVDGGAAFLDEVVEKGVAAVFPPRPDGRRAYLAAGPMKRFSSPTAVDPKIGRNEPCPCGSGVKFKRCHGG